EVVREAQERGFAVASLDWRGQGLSQRPLGDERKGHVRDFSQYDLDLDTFIKEIVLPDCPPPVFALAHSMGATIVIRAAHRGRRFVERVVWSAPMLNLLGGAGSRPAQVTARTLRFLGLGRSYLPTGGATSVQSKPFVGNILTSDPVRYERTAAIV